MYAQIVLAALVAAVVAQVPPPCSAPGLFSAKLIAVCCPRAWPALTPRAARHRGRRPGPGPLLLRLPPPAQGALRGGRCQQVRAVSELRVQPAHPAPQHRHPLPSHRAVAVPGCLLHTPHLTAPPFVMPIRGIEPPTSHLLTHFLQGVYYEVNLQTQVCTKGKLQGPFIPHGVGASVRPPAACSPAQSPTRPSSATTSLAPAPTLAAAS